jgi:hypothetical protein
MCLQLAFVIFWRNKIGAKDARKMLVKFIEGLNTSPNATFQQFQKAG